jgi:hypothetical protein
VDEPGPECCTVAAHGRREDNVGEDGPERPGGGSPGPAAGPGGQAAVRGGGLWLALLVPGVLAAAALPLSALAAARLPTGIFLETSQESLMRVLYLRGGVAVGPAGFPLGWYWTGVLAVSVAATGAWYRHRDQAAGQPGLLRGYLAAGAALVAVTAGLPLAGWRTSALSLDDNAAGWLGALWQQGTFALLAIAVTLGILARARRSWGLAAITVVYAAIAGLAGWAAAAPGIELGYSADAAPAVLLPAAVLLVAGTGLLLAAAVRRPLRPPGARARAHVT